MKRISRSYTIIATIYRYGLMDLAAKNLNQPWLIAVLRFLPQSALSKSMPLPVRLRVALENLGPIFIKFGQVLSTRRDLLSPDYAAELVKLQDNVPPFDGAIAQAQIESSLGKPIAELFAEFDPIPVASASVAQVHKAYLLDKAAHLGDKVAIKVLRPDIKPVIRQDLALLRVFAVLVEFFFVDGKRLKPKEVVAEFDQYLHDELDLMHEAANTSQLGRYFADSDKLIIPHIYFDYCARNVLTMQWMDGTPISELETLKAKGIALDKLAQMGVEIFFTQVFKYGFFHADMHPGNIFVSDDGRYIALDFGIVGSLTDYDKHYLAINFLAFFNRDYYRVATAHIESGWVPKETRAEDLAAAVRTVCEPIFNKPLAQISFGLVLLRLFETSRRFNVEVQPQLVLLQKTLLNIEGLGRQLDPNLDLWATAKPFLVKWMNEQVGFKALWRNIKKEAPDWGNILPSLPRRISEAFDGSQQEMLAKGYLELLKVQTQQKWLLRLIVVLLAVSLLLKWL